MNLIRFRVIIDIEEDVFRDILIDRASPLEDLHRGILAAFDFGEGEMASFFQSDEDWGRGREVPLMDMGMDDAGNPYPFHALRSCGRDGGCGQRPDGLCV